MRFFDLRGFLIGCAIVCILIAAYSAEFLNDKWSSFRFNTALERIERCTNEEDPIPCVRPIIREMLNMRSGADIVEMLSMRLSPLQCHYVIHAVGQQLFHKSGDIEVAIATCSRACNSACTHGIIGEAFLTEVGYNNPDFDLAHLGPDEIRSIGRRLCTAPQACHGVGHALFQAYQEFEPTMATCREVASRQFLIYCYQGGFMEYADIISMKGMRSEAELELPTREALGSFCNQPTIEERRACFRYFPRIFVAVLERESFSLEEAVDRLQELCRSLSDGEDRFACVAGVGAYFSDVIETDTQEAVRRCQSFTDTSYQIACNFGQISVSTQERRIGVFKFCTALPNAQLQMPCYQGLFFILNRLGVSVEEMTNSCGDNEICLGEIKSRGHSPSMYLESI